MIAFATVIIGLSCVVGAYRMKSGPTDADRAVAADLIFFGAVGFIALLGVSKGSPFTFDIVLIAALVGFLSALSLARILTKGHS